MPSAYPRSLQQTFRKSALIVGAGWRAYFTPFNQLLASTTSDTTIGPKIIDLAQGPFTHSALLAAGFFDTGWIKDFKFTVETKIGAVRSGHHGAVRAQFRGQVGESFEFKFREYGRLQYKLATGTNVMNLIAGSAPSTVGPLSASGGVATNMTSYAVNSGVASLTVASVSGMAVGDMVVADVDYDPTKFGIVGDSGVAVFRNAVTDVDYIRKNSDYVARIAAINGSVLTLDQPFAGGGSGNPTGFVVPQAGSKVQLVEGWCAREGGTFISEWTGLLLMDTEDISQIAVFYPHVSIMQERDVAGNWAIENVGTTDMTGYELDAQFQALAFDDPIDGETVVGYKAFFPPPNAGLAY